MRRMTSLLLVGGSLFIFSTIQGLQHIQAIDSPARFDSRKLQREIIQRRDAERKAHEVDLAWTRSRTIGASESQNRTFDNKVLRDATATPFRQIVSVAPPPQSPGLSIGETSYDFQGNASLGYQIARTAGADVVHFVWMSWDRLPVNIDDNERFVTYNSYSVSCACLNQGWGGVQLGGGATQPGFINLDVDGTNAAAATAQQREDVSLSFNPWAIYFPIPGNSLIIADGLGGYGAGGCPEVLWPRVAAGKDGGTGGTRHVIAHSDVGSCTTNLLWYWRYDGSSWTGPVIIDSTPQISYVIADDANGDKLAVVSHADNWPMWNGNNNVVYRESVTDGIGWINGTEPNSTQAITNYSDPHGAQAWLHLTTTYDNGGVLHVMWDEQEIANESEHAAIKHWNSFRSTIRTAALGYWDAPMSSGVFNLNLAKISMGIGDGATLCRGGLRSNLDYVYVVYTQFAGPTLAEQEDASLEGYYNGELRLTVSTDSGLSWSPSANLTSTKTPNCNPGAADTATGIPARPDSVCRSENWASIGPIVHDIDILFISDKDAGGVPQGEGTWQMNPVHYLRLPGGTTDAAWVCPAIAANIFTSLSSGGIDCEYHAPRNGSTTADLRIANLGSAELTGAISVTDFTGLPTLSLPTVGSYSLLPGDPDIQQTITMSGNGAPEGLYSGEISITHDDFSKISPVVFPIEFFVFDDFYCPQTEIFKTGVASPGSLALDVRTNGRFASQHQEGGLWRYSDSSSTLFDGSLLLAHGFQGTDTTVFLRFFNRNSNGQYGYRALGDLQIDTSAYGTHAGCARAVSRMCTRDSVLGIEVEWVFPQDLESDEMVLCRYKIYNHKPNEIVTDVAIGVLLDVDIIPASRLGDAQIGATNHPMADASREFIWARGVGQGDTLLSPRRFSGGVSVPSGILGARVGNAVSDIQLGGGPTDEFLYRSLQTLTGVELYPSDTDLYMLIALDRGKTIMSGDTLSYVLVYASDTISEASLKTTVDSGISMAALPDLCTKCSCPCHADPSCDGIRSDILDVVNTVNVAFRGTAPKSEPLCPRERTDVNCSGATDVVDIVKVINVAFRGANAATEYCVPCP